MFMQCLMFYSVVFCSCMGFISYSSLCWFYVNKFSKPGLQKLKQTKNTHRCFLSLVDKQKLNCRLLWEMIFISRAKEAMEDFSVKLLFWKLQYDHADLTTKSECASVMMCFSERMCSCCLVSTMWRFFRIFMANVFASSLFSCTWRKTVIQTFLPLIPFNSFYSVFPTVVNHHGNLETT